jgi:3-hydroxyisobutyrate dehydrogenase-like beta-hydroxyacid dehydrogenase
MTTVGVIGLGAIGAGVASGMARAGLDLVVNDVFPAATEPFADLARVAQSPTELGSLCDVVVVAVVDDAQVNDVLLGPDGALSTLRPGSTVVLVSTVSIPTVRALADAAAERSIDVVDCGVTGGPAAAASGELVSMVGGAPDVIERITPVLDAYSSLVVHMGPAGAGLQAKLARNVVQYGTWLAAFEGQKLAEAAGVDLSKLAAVIKASEPRTGGTTALMFRATVAPFGPQDDARIVSAMATAAKLCHKDVGAALSLAEDLGVSLPMAALLDDQCDAIFGIASDAPGESPGGGP